MRAHRSRGWGRGVVLFLVAVGGLSLATHGQGPAKVVSVPVEPLKAEAPLKNAGMFIGVNLFPQDETIHPLEFAVNDAVVLAYLHVVELKLIPPQNCFLCIAGQPTGDRVSQLEKLKSVKVRVTETATRTDILVAMGKLKEVTFDKSSLIVIGVSSHGLLDSSGVPYVIPSDGLRESLALTALQLNTLEVMLEETKAGHRLMMIDACQERIPAKSLGGAPPAAAMDARFLDALKRPTGQIKVASCKKGEFSYEDRTAGHGVFTNAILQAMRGRATPRPDNIVDLDAVLNATAAVLETRPQRERQSVSFEGENAALKMPLALRASGSVQLALTLKKKVSPRAGGFTQVLFDKLTAALPKLNSAAADDQELLEATREFAAGRLKENIYVAFVTERLNSATSPRPVPTSITSIPVTATEASGTEVFTEDFRSASNMGLPDGWVNMAKMGDIVNVLLVRQDAGRPHLRTTWKGYSGWPDGGVASVRLPPVVMQGDFYIELTALNNDQWEGKTRSMTLTLRGGDDDKLVCRTIEAETGFVTTFPGSDESTPFTLTGKTPYRYRLERKAGTYRILNNSKVLLTHNAEDNRKFNIVELELSPKMMVGSVKIGPLTTATADKPVVDKPEPKKPVKPIGRGK